MSVIGIDIGGTKIEVILYDGKKVLGQTRIPTDSNKPYKVIFDHIVTTIQSFQAHDVQAIGISTKGFLYKGKLAYAPTGLRGKAIHVDLQKKFNVPVVLENDAKCFAFAETMAGAAKGKKNVVGIIVGTGIGSGIIVNSSVYRGSIGSAGEVGHSPYKDKDFEYYASGPGIVRLYKEAGGTKELSTEQILKYKSFFRKDPAVTKAQEQAYDALGRLCATIIDTLNPEMIVFGGGVSKSLDYSRLRKATKQYCMPMPFENVKLVQFKIADSAGSIGAAHLAMQSIRASN
jgi:predicted NBD/HSP70 family sugar kinase